jgi:metal-responsive CopG/Arc/MetJ family transcriptional regulator
MKVKTSITLSAELLEILDRRAKKLKTNRSEFIEAAVWAFVRYSARAERNARDLEILNQRADRLNEEALDVLDYQAAL